MKPEAKKTLAEFKTYFRAADKDRRDNDAATAQSAGYLGAAAVELDAPPHQANAAATAAATATALSYCWTHGLVKNAEHTSATCKHKADGHQDTATANNKMGGNKQKWKPCVRAGEPLA
jgi:hypothetical protein